MFCPKRFDYVTLVTCVCFLPNVWKWQEGKHISLKLELVLALATIFPEIVSIVWYNVAPPYGQTTVNVAT